MRSSSNITTGKQLGALALLEQARSRGFNLTLDELSGSRLIASEHGSGSFEEMCCIIDAELNRSKARGMSLTDHLTGKTGVYGPQQGIRKASTRLNSRVRHLEAARAVLSGDQRGISRGAVRFFDPRTQDRQNAKFRAGATGTKVHSCQSLGTLRAWSFDLPKAGKFRCDIATGLPDPDDKPGPRPQEFVGKIPGVDAYRLMCFRPSKYGAEHTARFQEAAEIINSRSGLGSLLDDPAFQFLALLVLAVAL